MQKRLKLAQELMKTHAKQGENSNSHLVLDQTSFVTFSPNDSKSFPFKIFTGPRQGSMKMPQENSPVSTKLGGTYDKRDI